MVAGQSSLSKAEDLEVHGEHLGSGKEISTTPMTKHQETSCVPEVDKQSSQWLLARGLPRPEALKIGMLPQCRAAYAMQRQVQLIRPLPAPLRTSTSCVDHLFAKGK